MAEASDDLGLLALAVALNPEVAEALKQNPEEAAESIGLRLSQPTLTAISRIVQPKLPRPGTGDVFNVRFPASSCRVVSSKIRSSAAERLQFVENPGAYLRNNGLEIPEAMIPSKQELEQLLGQGTERVDPGSVAIAV